MTTVLTFHRVVDRLEQDHDLRWDNFLRLADSVSASTTDLEEGPTHRAVAMTFDDGTEDHLRAAEELQRRGLTGIFFIPAGHIGMTGRLDSAQVRALASMGHVVGSHAFHHRPLDGISFERLRQQVRESRIRLEEICERPVILFAPPGGIGHQGLVPALKSEAYRASRSMRWGIFRDPTRPWDIPCVPVTEYTWQRGWVSHAIDRHSLALSMRLGRTVKAALPTTIAKSMRENLHARQRQP